MKSLILRNALAVLFFAVVFFASANKIFAQNSINGVIFDTNRQPVGKIDVELLDAFERLIKSTKTTTSGLYFFQGLSAGVYYVQVRVDGTNYQPAKERIQLGEGNRTSITGRLSGGESMQVNFVLQIESRGNSGEPASSEIVFAQNVPEEAEEFYKDALKSLERKNNAEATLKLESAIRVFPEYFLALDRLGYEYVLQNKFAEAEKVFARALKINPKSFSSKSGLGIAEYKLGKKQEAVKTLEEAVEIDPFSANSLLFLGKIYRELKEFEKAESVLKKAKSLSKNKLADVHWELALLYYYNLERYADAAEELELYLKANPKAENRRQIERLIKTMREKAGQKN
jgi:Tfp pilus assembly protein PilF